MLGSDSKKNAYKPTAAYALVGNKKGIQTDKW